NCR
ncbi:hlyD secretion family protein, partial [Vibrio parahaemolyticus V-223/04]